MGEGKDKNLDEAEFDKFASEYRELHAKNVKLSGESPEYFSEYKLIDVRLALADSNFPLDRAFRALDFGAGIGNSVPYFRKHLPLAELTCLDVSRKSLEIGRTRFSDLATFLWFDGNEIPFDAGTFDLIFVSCIFHHIPHERHAPVLAELRRVLSPGGRLFVFEHNPINPLTVHAVNCCPFDENARLISPWRMRNRLVEAGFAQATLRFRLFFPHFLHRLRPLESRLGWLPLGAQYYVDATS